MVTRTKGDRTTWTANSLATPELIDEYVSGIGFGKNDEVTCAAREAASVFCKRKAKIIMECTTDGKKNYKISDIAESALVFVEGFDAGVLWALEKAYRMIRPNDLNRE